MTTLTRVDESPVDIIPRLEVSAESLTSIDQRYPRAGRPNAIVELYVEDVTSHKRVKMDLGHDTDFYLARVDWAKDGRTLYAQRLTRDQKRLLEMLRETLPVDNAPAEKGLFEKVKDYFM